MRPNPLFSVITVCYNDLANLKRTAASVLEQSCKDFEWLVVDGGSRDGTPDWLAQLPPGQCVWSSERDAGIFDAMNKGCDQARGQYLVFMNSGDLFFNPRVLELVSEAIRSQPGAQLLYGDSVDETADGHGTLRHARHHDGYQLGMFAQHQAMFFRASPLRYRTDRPITADYAYIGEHIQAAQDPVRIVKLDFAVCRFLLGGLNEKARFAALREDYRTRIDVFGMNRPKAAVLYAAHYAHTWLKRHSPGIATALRR
ncbi:glycosyltransferase family 2 protein [Sphaerotilus microaerophilus]|uniref:Colanic acid biosynthesis glycosyltransferase WcaE n=1 Tax=Sphaerotilus microaerophilus TaxID=2914710 RepID=A0ABM7YKP0_9BURK|nr:glycosyltransferase family 2 protein [Sphaerotilus sp. FB-5]BDI04937.1 colanic acid biosynthesis glycosyltransferase WcaE [Sphaerotilus sp. FB-5]